MFLYDYVSRTSYSVGRCRIMRGTVGRKRTMKGRPAAAALATSLAFSLCGLRSLVGSFFVPGRPLAALTLLPACHKRLPNSIQ